jgi:hypothetical protein
VLSDFRGYLVLERIGLLIFRQYYMEPAEHWPRLYSLSFGHGDVILRVLGTLNESDPLVGSPLIFSWGVAKLHYSIETSS